MTITFPAPVPATVEITGRGFSKPEDAFSAAAKLRGYTVRGSKYFDETGERFPVLDRAEGALIFLGYRWVTRVDGRWFVVEV